MSGSPYEAPEDLVEFWQLATAEAMASPLEMSREVGAAYPSETHDVEILSFRSISGSRLNGWIATPKGIRRAPGFVWIPPYGRESVLPNQYGTRDGFVSLSFNFHGEPAFHQEKYIIERGYFAQGAESPETWIFRRLYQDAVIASRVLQAQIEVDEDRIGAMGMSQGGGISIWQSAWNPIIKAVCSDMPFLGNIGSTLLNSVYRYPLKEVKDFMDELPLGEARVMNTLSYFDTAIVSAHCRVPTQVSLGLKDPACRPDSVRAIYEPIPVEKDLHVLDWGHDYHPAMVEKNRDWLLNHL